MASLLVKRVASNLSRVRKIASFSRFFSTKGYEFVQHDSKEECILTCDDRLGSSAARGAVNDAFSPHASPTENLACLFNVSDLRIGYVHGTHVFPRWSLVEDDKALYIFRGLNAQDIEDVRESVKEFMNGNHEENFNQLFSLSEEYISGNVKENFNEPVSLLEEYISGNVKENFNEPVSLSEEEYTSRNVSEILKQYDPKRNAFPIIDFMRGDGYAPTGDYYYHVLKDDKEVKQFVESFRGSPDTVNGINASIKIYVIPYKPQAVYILVVLGHPQTRNPYGGYAMEIFLDNSLYSVCDMKTDFTDVNTKLFIPKKKVERTKAIGGNLIFFQEKKFIKPTPWRPT